MIDPLFQFHKLNEQGQQNAICIAELFTRLLNDLQPLLPLQSRELSIVRTKLEEACFFAKKAVAVLPENQQ